MKNYERPTVVTAGELAEGVYMISGAGETVSLSEAMEPVTDTPGYSEKVALEEATAGGIEDSVGEAPGDASVEGDITEAPGEVETPEDVDAEYGVDADTGAGTDADVDNADADGDGKPDKDTDDPEDDLENASEESGGMQASARIRCESRYMNGVWQGTRQGAWGGMKLGCKELLGCSGCPADNRDGCGLQKPNFSRYYGVIGSLKPEWEAAGKGPDDDPYGI